MNGYSDSTTTPTSKDSGSVYQTCFYLEPLIWLWLLLLDERKISFHFGKCWVNDRDPCNICYYLGQLYTLEKERSDTENFCNSSTFFLPPILTFLKTTLSGFYSQGWFSMAWDQMIALPDLAGRRLGDIGLERNFDWNWHSPKRLLCTGMVCIPQPFDFLRSSDPVLKTQGHIMAQFSRCCDCIYYLFQLGFLTK